MHQLVEYLIGMVLIAAAFQSPTPTAQAVLGLAIMINSAITRGGAGAFKLIGPRVHRVIDLVIVVLLVVAGIQPWIDVDATGRLLLPAMAVVMLFVWMNTDFADEQGRSARRPLEPAPRARSSAGRPAASSATASTPLATGVRSSDGS